MSQPGQKGLGLGHFVFLSWDMSSLFGLNAEGAKSHGNSQSLLQKKKSSAALCGTPRPQRLILPPFKMQTRLIVVIDGEISTTIFGHLGIDGRVPLSGLSSSVVEG